MNLNDYKNALFGIDIVRLVDDVMKKHKEAYNLEMPWIKNVAALEGEEFALEIISTLRLHRQIIQAIDESYCQIEKQLFPQPTIEVAAPA